MLSRLRTYQKEISRIRKEEVLKIPLWRYFFRWKRSLNPAHNSIRDRTPWISFLVIDFLKKTLDTSMKVFEYGGGGSTLFFLDHAGEVATVEHDAQWYKVLERAIADSSCKEKWKGYFIEPEDALHADVFHPHDPDLYVSTEQQFAKKTFNNYASAIDTYPDAYFHFVLVDGRSRPACMKHAIPKIKSGGYLILDNSDRDFYLTCFKNILQNDFRVIIHQSAPTPYCSWFNRTSVWQKK